MTFEPVDTNSVAGTDFVPLWQREKPRAAAGDTAPTENHPAPEPAHDAASAPADASLLRDEGYREGVSEGQQKALDIVNGRLQEQISQWTRMIESLSSKVDAELSRVFDDLESRVPVLSTAVAEKLVRGELRADPAILRRIIAEALSRVKDDVSVKLRVNPTDRELIERWLKDQPLGGKSLVLAEDPDVESGGLFVEADGKRLDYSLSNQLERIRSDLQRIYEQVDS